MSTLSKDCVKNNTTSTSIYSKEHVRSMRYLQGEHEVKCIMVTMSQA